MDLYLNKGAGGERVGEGGKWVILLKKSQREMSGGGGRESSKKRGLLG